MRSGLASIVLVTGVAAVTSPAWAASNAAADVAAVLRARHQAFERGDAAAYRKLVAESALFAEPGNVHGLAEQLKGEVHPAVGYVRKNEISNLRVEDVGDTALVSYDMTLRNTYGSQSTVSPSRVLETYARRDGRWLLVLHVELPPPFVPRFVSVSAAELDAFVGKYAWSEGFVDVVTRAGDTLMSTVTGASSFPLRPVSARSFVIEGDADYGETTFVTDAAGKVTHYVYKTRTSEIVARKIE